MREPLICLIAPFLLTASPAYGEDTISGSYVEGKQKVSVNIHSWGEDCGPKPKSYSKKGGKKVTVELKGDNLHFSDGSSTKKCWSDNTRLKRLSAAKKGNSWVTICETPENDSRFERGVYTVKQTQQGLLFINKSTYNWQLKNSICRAVITIKKNYTRVDGKKGEIEVPEEKPKEASAGKCKTVGSISRLAIAPSRVKLGAGEKVCFSVYGLDSKGCRIPVSSHLAMSPPRSGTEAVLEKHCFTSGTNAALSEGTFKITASTDVGMTATAKLEVKFSNIEDLIAVNLSPSSLSGSSDEASSLPHAMPPSGFIKIKGPGRDGAWKIWVFLIPIGALVFIGGIIIISITIARVRFARRKLKRTVLVDEEQKALFAPAPGPATEKKAQPKPQPEPKTKFGLEHGVKPSVKLQAAPITKKPFAQPASRKEDSTVEKMWMHCEVCNNDFKPGSVHCPYDGTRLKPYRELSYLSARGGLICPVCRRGYPNDFIQCPKDKEYLIPYSVFRSSTAADGKTAGKQKICPVCQTKYDESEIFCKSDGSKLEPIQ